MSVIIRGDFCDRNTHRCLISLVNDTTTESLLFTNSLCPLEVKCSPWVPMVNDPFPGLSLALELVVMKRQ